MIDFDKLKAYRQYNPETINTKLKSLEDDRSVMVETEDLFEYMDYAMLSHDMSGELLRNKLLRLREFYDKRVNLRFAGICVYPNYISSALEFLKNTKSQVIAVTGNFPSGQSNLKNKLLETRYAIDEGADEIDYIYNPGNMLDEKFELVFEEIAAVKDVCKEIPLKIIIETALLPDLRSIRIATEIALKAGANFVKTSTGKLSGELSLEICYVMATTLNQFIEETGEKRGLKFSGGIASKKMVGECMNIVLKVLNKPIVTAPEFRIGAGNWAEKLIEDLS